jgi:hypothetical protein
MDSAPVTTQSPLDRPLDRTLDRTLEIAWLGIVLVVCCVMSLRTGSAVDPDLWWRLRAGDWITAHHAVPWQDSFGRYTLGHEWLDYAWLTNWILSATYRIAGLSGVMAFTGILMLGCITSALVLVSSYIPQGWALVLIVFYRVALMPVTTPRPWLFSILLLTLELIVLLRASEGNKPKLLLWLLPILALWANLHIQFVYGLGLIFIFAIAASLPPSWRSGDGVKVSAARLWIILALGISATLANPYGFHIYTVVAQYAFDKAGLFGISEMQPFALTEAPDWIAISLLCAAVAAVARARNKSALSWLLLLAGCWFGFQKQRDAWFLVILSVTVCARALRDISRPNPLRWPAIAGAVLIVGALYCAQLRTGSVNAAFLKQETARLFPSRAADFIESSALPDPLFNPFGWGGYIIWRLPGRLVSIDGRSNLYGNDGMSNFLSTVNGAPNWRDNPAFQKANTVLINRQSALASLLRLDSGYRLAYEDQLAVVFVRR